MTKSGSKKYLELIDLNESARNRCIQRFRAGQVVTLANGVLAFAGVPQRGYR